MLETLLKPYLFVLPLTPICLVLLTMFLRTRKRNLISTHWLLTALCALLVVLTFPIGDGHIFNMFVPIIGIFILPVYWLRDALIYLPAALFIGLCAVGKPAWTKSLLLVPLLLHVSVCVVRLCIAGAFLSLAFHVVYLAVVVLFFIWECARHNSALAWTATALFLLAVLGAAAVQAAVLFFPQVEDMLQAIVDDKLSYYGIFGISIFNPMRQLGTLTFFPLLTHLSAVALSGIRVPTRKAREAAPPANAAPCQPEEKSGEETHC